MTANGWNASPSWRSSTLPQIVDELARDNPDYVYGSWPAPGGTGSSEITYSQLAIIVDELASWLTGELGVERQGEVLTYVGPSDVRFTALVLASIKTGFKLFLTSPRNSPVAHRKLFEVLRCETLITPDPAAVAARAVLDAVGCRLLVIPGVDALLSGAAGHHMMEKSLGQSLSDTLFIIHTSGSTGIPKPLNWTLETAVRHIEATSRDPPTGATSIDSLFRGKRVLSTLPPFHGAGLLQYLMYAIPFGNVPIIPLATGPIVTAHGVVETLKKTPADVAVMVPSIVAELAQHPDLLDYCASHLEFILYIGGDLPQAVGDIVAFKVRLHCWWGASEVGMPHQLIIPELGVEEGWHYVRFHPCTGAVFDQVSDGLYELVIRRDDEIIDTQTNFTIGGFENGKEYRTRDLFEPHAMVPDAWRWRARADDIIVFLNGEKTNPVSMEQFIVSSNPDKVSGALVVGAQKFQAALVIDPVGSGDALNTAEQASLIEQVWPSVEEANQKAPAHARVEKAMILVAGRPFIRAGKGTIQRAATVAQYTTEIESLYTRSGAMETYDESGQHEPVTDVGAATSLIKSAVGGVLGSPIGDSDNFFDSGMDSLQALRLLRIIRAALGRPELALSAIYQNATSLQLANSAIAGKETESDVEQITQQLLSTYRTIIQQIPKSGNASQRRAPGEEPADVLLTGTTGTLGTSILDALLKSPHVGHIFCLNRRSDGGRVAQLERFSASGLNPGQLEERVTFLQANLADINMGLDEAAYQMLSSRIRIVIHNAWPVNFNLSLLAFRPALAGLSNIFKFVSAAASPSPRTFFVSSVGAVAGISASPETVPDETVTFKSPLANGYSRSKFIAELLCDSAARELGVPVTILRVGQVGGSTAQHGAVWSKSEWLPSLVISSGLTLGCLPDSLGPVFSEVDWVPSDLLGSVVAELTLATSTSSGKDIGADVFNVRNPYTTSWDALIPSVQEAIKVSCGRDAKAVPAEHWLACLSDMEKSPSDEELARNPAIKLLQFYRSLWSSEVEISMPMTVDDAVEASHTLRDMPAVGKGWVMKWVQEWLL
ncbi:putative NRPS-like enzyme [Astrocystis sublimbata]|nr:putative NRPS-like enzyme [Astrocystis sublimbata]